MAMMYQGPTIKCKLIEVLKASKNLGNLFAILVSDFEGEIMVIKDYYKSKRKKHTKIQKHNKNICKWAFHTR